jgi:TPR repeat protein
MSENPAASDPSQRPNIYRLEALAVREILADDSTDPDVFGGPRAMRKLTKARILALALSFSLAVPVAAGPREDAATAYQRGDYGVAFRLWRPLAEQGDARAQAELGWMYNTGEGVAQNRVQAASWYRKAADQGLADAHSG